jgi:hypothetical protein
MATLSFLSAGGLFSINNLSGSGLGFYGTGFGNSVSVGSYQDTTYITDSAGTSLGPQVNNIKYLNVASGIVNSASSGVPLISIPNYMASLNIRFSHSSNVKTQNAKLRIYDRANYNNDPSGVLCKVAELVHPSIIGLPTGSGSTTWNTPAGSSVILTCISSPGASGIRPNGAQTTDAQHDWYFAITASPNSIGSKTFACYFELEYL